MIRATQKIWIVSVLLGCLLAGIIVLLGDGGVIGERQSQNDKGVEFGIWTRDSTFEQTFTAVDDELFRIDFWLDSYHPWDSPYLECRLFELDVDQPPYNLTYEYIRQHSREVRYRKLNGWLLSPHMFNQCAFDPIPDSQGKRYLFFIQSPEVKYGGSSILMVSSRKRWETENFFVDGRKQEYDLAFRVLYKYPRMDVLRESFARLALEKPFPFSSSFFYVLLFVLYLMLMLILFWKIWQVTRQKARKIS